MLDICITRDGTDHFCEVLLKSQQFDLLKPDKLNTDGQSDGAKTISFGKHNS
jgi:hypothetical protein